MTEFKALVANDDDRLSPKLGSPVTDDVAEAANGSRHEAWISRKVIACAHVNQSGHLGVPISRTSFSEAMLLTEDMTRPC
jgi:hypothetical protein